MPPQSDEKGADKTPDSFIVEWIKKIQPAHPIRWDERRVPTHIYHITTRAEWMKHANIYMPPATSHSGFIECCDVDRLDAFVSRNYFYKEYAECGVNMDTYFWRAMRKLEECKDSLLLRITGSRRSCMTAAQSSALDVNSRMHSPYNASESLAEVTERTDLVLIVIGTASLLSDGSLRWGGTHSYPYITRALYKNGDSCSDFRVRYDIGYATLCIPSREEIAARERTILMSNHSIIAS